MGWWHSKWRRSTSITFRPTPDWHRSAWGQTVISKIGFERASSYLTVKPGNDTIDLQLTTTTVPLVAMLEANMVMLEANNVTSVFGVGSVNGSGSSAFKFVVVTAPAMPTGMPDTGFDPHPLATGASSDVTGTTPYCWPFSRERLGLPICGSVFGRHLARA
jgi:hypothetical protein